MYFCNKYPALVLNLKKIYKNPVYKDMLDFSKRIFISFYILLEIKKMNDVINITNYCPGNYLGFSVDSSVLSKPPP